MKQIIAIIQPQRLDEVEDALHLIEDDVERVHHV